MGLFTAMGMGIVNHPRLFLLLFPLLTTTYINTCINGTECVLWVGIEIVPS